MLYCTIIQQAHIDLKENIKSILRTYPFLYNAVNKLNKSLTKEKGTNVYSSTESFLENNKIKKIDDEIPFIRGIINQENEDFSISKTNTKESLLEYTNWHRSHGGNWNTKYDSSNYINVNNISKLKLIWEYSSINNASSNKINNLESHDYKILKNKWKQNIELNPKLQFSSQP